MADKRAWPRPDIKWEPVSVGEKVMWRGKTYHLGQVDTDPEGSVQLTLLTPKAWEQRRKEMQGKDWG